MIPAKRPISLIPSLLAGLAALMFAVLITAELYAIFSSGTLPIAVRNWLLWGSLMSTTFSGFTLIHVRMTQSERAMQARMDGLESATKDRIDAVLMAAVADGLNAQLASAVEKAVGPTLHAITDYNAIERRISEVTHLHPRN